MIGGNMRKSFLIFIVIVLSAAIVSCTSARNGAETTAKPTDPLSLTENTEKTKVCSFLIECKTALSNSVKLDPSVAEYLPENGIILDSVEVPFEEGESVADVLRRVCTDNSIPLETSGTNSFNTIYVEGIGHLYEFDCGEGSGWMYRVNGEYPNYGADSYMLSDGDAVEWRYTCDFGADIGGMEEH
jgi:hypothetical protein